MLIIRFVPARLLKQQRFEILLFYIHGNSFKHMPIFCKRTFAFYAKDYEPNKHKNACQNSSALCDLGTYFPGEDFFFCFVGGGGVLPSKQFP